MLALENRSCRLWVFLSALAQKRHPAKQNSRRVTYVNRDSNVFRFCNKLIFTGVGYQPQPNPQPGRQGSHTSSVLYPLTCLAWVALPGVQDSS